MPIYAVMLICAVTLSACESPDARDMDLMVRSGNAFDGKPIQTVIDRLGPPEAKIDTARGHTYKWRFVNGKLLVAGAPNGTPGSACTVVLETDPATIVRKTNSSIGPGCPPVWKRMAQ